ncbi:hypothetical protein GDO86_004807, partial [Hymenochirus boettgeri]
VHCLVLDMADGAFDDQYIGCTEQMGYRTLALLEAEMESDPIFRGSWEKAAWEFRKRRFNSSLPLLPQGFQEEHGIALLVYTDKNYPSPDNSFPSLFNKLMRTSVSSLEDYQQNFPYKALHYYLTTALHLFQPECRVVYRGIRDVHFEPPRETKANIRFGQFTSSSFSQATAKGFGQDSFFHITTCYGVNIGLLSTDRTENEILIPGEEMFQVSMYRVEGHQFVLNSTKRRCHHYNCALLGGNKDQSKAISVCD